MGYIRDKIELAVEASMQMIPVVGGPLATLYFGNKEEKRFKRIEAFYKEIACELQGVQDKIKNIDEHDSEELSAIIEELNEKVEVEHIRLKVELYKTYFKKTMILPINNNYSERKLFLDIIAQLTPLQIELIIFLVQQNTEVIARTITKEGVEQYIILGCISQLKILGLVESELSNITFSTEGNAINESIRISELGVKFHKFCISQEY